MEPEGSLPHSEVPATCPYPEPARSSPYPHVPLHKGQLLLTSYIIVDPYFSWLWSGYFFILYSISFHKSGDLVVLR